ncbi:site-2 protease family protein [Sphingomonas sp. TREG-RG-20F-R18-01]|uniref:site-2 protease family protein n=1 Tax=Sphingomonas sp. TREG-RG-20F-R18-01 TaxID=2914982 RepID=UPI001F583D3D|nr:site-2 protease family protein [Sphingomonas sp. TREG-RG-20F-R18-01]
MTDPNLPYTIAVWLIPLVIAIVFHEVAHGYVARIFGDPTADRLGRLTLNPLRHVDPIGTVVLPMILAIAHAPIFGWAKPVPVDASRLRNPRRDMMLVALAGPATNFVLATFAALALGAFVGLHGGIPAQGAPHTVAGFVFDSLYSFVLVNVFLGVFNLIPLPPFDGGHVVQGLLPRAAAIQYSKLARFGFPLLLFLLFVLPMISPQADIVRRVIGPIASTVADFFLGFAQLGGL